MPNKHLIQFHRSVTLKVLYDCCCSSSLQLEAAGSSWEQQLQLTASSSHTHFLQEMHILVMYILLFLLTQYTGSDVITAWMLQLSVKAKGNTLSQI